MEIVYLRLFTVGVGVFVIPVLVQAIITWSVTNHERKEDEKVASKARTFPYRYPLLKSTIPFLFDAVTLFQKASCVLFVYTIQLDIDRITDRHLDIYQLFASDLSMTTSTSSKAHATSPSSSGRHG